MPILISGGVRTCAIDERHGTLSLFYWTDFDPVKQRYGSWDSGVGQKIESGGAGFEDLEKYMLEKGDATPNVSGRQEMLENVLNRYVEMA